MKRITIVAIFGSLLIHAASPVAGRWDIKVSTDKDTYPDWMELVEKDGAPQVRVQPRTGSVHPVTNVKLDGSHLTLTFSAATKKNPEVTWDVTVSGDRLTGTQKRGDAVVANSTAYARRN